MYSMLEKLADMTDKMANTDFSAAPNMKCAQALIDTLVDQEGFGPALARKIVLRMKIDVSDFDLSNAHWQRIVSNYATIINKLYTISEDNDTMLAIASTLTLSYEE